MALTIREGHFQQRFKINIWAGILDDQVIGPFELRPKLSGEEYLSFLANNLPELLEQTLDNMPLQRRQNVWFIHDGAQPHIFRDVIQHLNEHYLNRWIGRNAPDPRKWPTRSPDLNPMDFWYWGELKEMVCGAGLIRTEAQLREKNFNAAEIINGQLRRPRVRKNSS